MTKFMRIAGIVAVLVLGAGLIAACGSDDKETYAQEVEDVLEPLGGNLDTLGTELSGASDEAELADGLEEAQNEITSAADEIAGLEVPDGVEQVNDDLVAALNGFADELGKVRDAAESGDLAQLQQAAAGLPAVASAFEQELTDIQNAAIDAGVPIEDPDS